VTKNIVFFSWNFFFKLTSKCKNVLSGFDRTLNHENLLQNFKNTKTNLPRNTFNVLKLLFEAFFLLWWALLNRTYSEDNQLHNQIFRHSIGKNLHFKLWRIGWLNTERKYVKVSNWRSLAKISKRVLKVLYLKKWWLKGLVLNWNGIDDISG
jgi:hypothetical protein